MKLLFIILDIIVGVQIYFGGDIVYWIYWLIGNCLVLTLLNLLSIAGISNNLKKCIKLIEYLKTLNEKSNRDGKE